jgi:hypothetical protein
MNPLSKLESMLANLVEGTFGRLFRSEVRPMELARRLAREMDEHRTQSVSRVYAPNEYTVWLSPEDRELYEGVEQELIGELCGYLLEHARRQNLILPEPPRIAFQTDERLRLGQFGIETRMGRPEDSAPDLQQPAPSEQRPAPAQQRPAPSVRPAPAQQALPEPEWQEGQAQAGRQAPPQEGGEDGGTLIFSSSQRVGAPVREARARRAARAILVVGEKRVLVPPGGAVLGRSRECDVVLDDSGVSRRHAEIRPSGEGWTVRDLGSTNGVRLNDRTLRGAQPLQLGDRLELGSTEIVFELR